MPTVDLYVVIAGCFATVSVAVSFYEIVRHLSNFTKPYLQRYIIRILLMVPIYSLNAWIAMALPVTGLYLDSMREVYESYVIYSFMKYLLNFLKYETNLQQYIHHKPGPNHIFPFCLLPKCIGGKRFLIKCKHGILQYVVVRPITTLVAFISQQFGFYGEGNYNPLSGYVYPVLLVVNNLSQLLAMYSLVIFYTGFQSELRPMKPLAKFFSIKLVVFFSFFQSVLISGLLEIDVIAQTMQDVFFELGNDKVKIGRKIQELLICFDMLLASIGHLYAFPYLPYTEPDYRRSSRLTGSTSMPSLTVSPSALGPDGRYYGHDSDNDDGSDRTCCWALCSIFDFSEDKSDISEHLGQIFSKLRQIFTPGPLLPTIVSESDDDQAGTNRRGSADSGTEICQSRAFDDSEDATDSKVHSTSNSSVKNYQSING